MKIHKGDTVQVMVGKDAGKQGKIIRVRPDDHKVLVEGLNLIKRHRKPRKQGEKGEIITAPRFISAANVMMLCPKCGKLTRVGYSIKNTATAKATAAKSRICKKCKGEL